MKISFIRNFLKNEGDLKKGKLWDLERFDERKCSQGIQTEFRRSSWCWDIFWYNFNTGRLEYFQLWQCLFSIFTASIWNLTNLRNLSADASFICKSTLLLSFQYKFEGLEYESKIFLITKSLQIFFYTLINYAKGVHSCNLSAAARCSFL